jgi:hypothetical protein
MAHYSPRELREKRDALAAFRTAYEAYLANPSPATKSAAMRVLPDAEYALHTGGGGVVLIDAPAYGGTERRGLAQTAFLHETGWGDVHGRHPAELVLEGIDQADAVLAAEERKAAAERRRPTYWLDRAVRTALMPLAYIVSVIVGGSARNIDRSAFGLPLRVLSIAADALGVYGAGKLFGWW